MCFYVICSLLSRMSILYNYITYRDNCYLLLIFNLCQVMSWRFDRTYKIHVLFQCDIKLDYDAYAKKLWNIDFSALDRNIICCLKYSSMSIPLYMQYICKCPRSICVCVCVHARAIVLWFILIYFGDITFIKRNCLIFEPTLKSSV